MKKILPIVVFAVAVVLAAVILMSRPDSDSEAINADERLAEASATAKPDRASVVEQESSGEEREDLFLTLLRVWMVEDRDAAVA